MLYDKKYNLDFSFAIFTGTPNSVAATFYNVNVSREGVLTLY